MCFFLRKFIPDSGLTLALICFPFTDLAQFKNSQNFKEKTQYLMNTLYLQKNVSTPIRDVGANAVLLGHMICVCVCVYMILHVNKI